MAFHDEAGANRRRPTDRHRRQDDHGHVDAANGFPDDYRDPKLRNRLASLPTGPLHFFRLYFDQMDRLVKVAIKTTVSDSLWIIMIAIVTYIIVIFESKIAWIFGELR